MRINKYALILIVITSLNSCGLVKTLYNNASEITNVWLDDYFDFTQPQQSVLKPALYQLHNWHRHNQLPSYVAIIQDIQNDIVDNSLSANEVCLKIDAIQDTFSELQLESIPIIVKIAPLLSNEQLQHFQTKLDKRALKWKSEWFQETREEQMQTRLDKMEDYAEKVYGNLDKSQVLLLKKNLAATLIRPEISYAEIKRRNENAYQIITSLQNQALTPKVKYQLIKVGFEQLKNSPNPAYKAYADQLKQHTCEIITALHLSTNAQQKKHAMEWLENYKVQFSSLSGQTNIQNVRVTEPL